MEQEKKYFLWNKKSDFTKGFLEHLIYTDEGLRLEHKSDQSGTFFSAVLDSRERGMVWHRIQMKSQQELGTAIQCLVYNADTRNLTWKGETKDVEEWLFDSGTAIEEKEKQMEPYLIKTEMEPFDFLIHETKGRYLWLCIKFYGQGSNTPTLQRVKIHLPKRTLLRYLPEVYQEDSKSSDFLERYLGIFQSCYEDLEETIAGVAQYFEVENTPLEFLQWLAAWVGMEDYYIWPEDSLRYLLKNAMSFYQWRGTKKSVLELVKLYTKEEPYLVEQSKLELRKTEPKTKELLEALYGTSPYMFTVLVREEVLAGGNDYNILLKIIEKIKPAHMELNLVVLKPFIFLNSYSYLGVNSVMGQYRNLCLDGSSAVPFTTIAIS